MLSENAQNTKKTRAVDASEEDASPLSANVRNDSNEVLISHAVTNSEPLSLHRAGPPRTSASGPAGAGRVGLSPVGVLCIPFGTIFFFLILS